MQVARPLCSGFSVVQKRGSQQQIELKHPGLIHQYSTISWGCLNPSINYAFPWEKELFYWVRVQSEIYKRWLHHFGRTYRFMSITFSLSVSRLGLAPPSGWNRLIMNHVQDRTVFNQSNHIWHLNLIKW